MRSAREMSRNDLFVIYEVNFALVEQHQPFLRYFCNAAQNAQEPDCRNAAFGPGSHLTLDVRTNLDWTPTSEAPCIQDKREIPSSILAGLFQTSLRSRSDRHIPRFDSPESVMGNVICLTDRREIGRLPFLPRRPFHAMYASCLAHSGAKRHDEQQSTISYL